MLRKSILVFAVLIFAAGFKLDATKDISVEKIDKAKLSKLIKERKGKILFLNLWATWCVPCREEFPSIVKLSEEYKEVDFAAISVDFPDEVNSKIIPFLKSNNAKFTCFVNGFEGDEALINALDKKWNGALPATFIYDKSGKKISFLEGKQSYDQFKKEIEKAKK